MLHPARVRRATWLAVAALLCVVLVTTAAGQRKSARSKGPRALALVQWLASAPPRVIPVAIMVDGRFYDASIYKASPVPMALEPGTVYEVEKSGESQGLVTLTDAQQTAQGAWFSDGRYQTHAQLAAAHAPRKAAKSNAAAELGGPPRLRRGPAPASAGSEPAPAPATSAARGPDEPPVLRKPASEKQAQTPAAEGARATSAASTSEPARDESGRPILRRGRPSAEQAESLPGGVSTTVAPGKPGTPAAAPGKAALTAVSHVLPAISDASGPPPHSYLFDWSPQEKQRLTSAVEALALSALADYARAHPGARPGKLDDVQVRAFDVDYNNSPDIVLTASAAHTAQPAIPARRPAPAAVGTNSAATTYWVTVVAREDLNGDLRKLKVWVTDNKHLDAFPRVQLIDAVDADGDGRGELLFREISDVGRSYVIYRVTPDYLTSLFNSAELEQ